MSDRGLRWIAVALGLAIAPYLALAAFVHPTGDDFDYAMDTRVEGYWPALQHQYVGWNGRFASNLLVLANPMVGGSIVLYRVVAAAMIVATIAAIYLLIRAIAGAALDRKEAFICSLALTGVYLAGVPALGESFYWFTGSVTYQLSSVLLMVQIALFLRARSPIDGIVASALLVFVAGMNEIAMALSVAFYAVYAVWMMKRGQPKAARGAAALLAIAVAAGLAVWLAPGNAVRSAQFAQQHQWLRAMALTMAQTVRFAIQWTTSGPLLLATLLFIPLARRFVARVAGWRDITAAECAVLVAAPLVAIAIGVFPPYWATGMLGQHRTVSVAYGAFLILWFVAVIALEARGVWPAVASASPLVPSALVAALAGAIALTQNGYTVTADLFTGRARHFDRAMSERYDALERCHAHGDRECVVAPLADVPASFYVADVSADSSHWINRGYARYFGVADVRH